MQGTPHPHEAAPRAEATPHARSSVAGVVRKMLRKPLRWVRQEMLPRALPPSGFSAVPEPHVHVVGLLSSASGIGKSARLCIEVLERAGYRVTAENVAPLFSADDGLSYAGKPANQFRPGGVILYHLNPSMLLPGLIRAGLGRYYRSYAIGYWAWELEDVPPEWVACLRFMHAVMVPSSFCQHAILRHTAKPVFVVPHPVAEQSTEQMRATEQMRVRSPAGKFRVVNIFRFGSSFERKNPIALVQAFDQAFGADPDVELVLKTSDGERFPEEAARLRRSVAGRGNVHIVDQMWPEEQVTQLMHSAHVYASLHRSEGFGLPLAEAMAAGIPVVATGWSGNVDFCAPDTAFPVDYDLVPFRDDHGDYAQVKNARWAEPLVDHAAAQLVAVRHDYAAARAKALKAAEALRRHIAMHDYPAALASLARHAPGVAGDARLSPSVSRGRP